MSPGANRPRAILPKENQVSNAVHVLAAVQQAHETTKYYPITDLLLLTMVVLLLVSGVQSMILGVLGEYVGRTFLSANGKPQGTVRSVTRSTDLA